MQLKLFETSVGIQFTIRQSLWDMKFYAELLGGEFSNCYGSSSTFGGAINSLRFHVVHLRRKRELNGNTVS